MTTLAGVGIVGVQKPTAASSTVVRGSVTVPMASGVRPTWVSNTPAVYVPVGGKGGGRGIQQPQQTPEADSRKGGKSTIEEKDAQNDSEEFVLQERTENGPPNPKKRMYEQENDNTPQKRDEL